MREAHVNLSRSFQGRPCSRQRTDLAWGVTYYLPAILASAMARDLTISTGVVFGLPTPTISHPAKSIGAPCAAPSVVRPAAKIRFEDRKDVSASANVDATAGKTVPGAPQ